MIVFFDFETGGIDSSKPEIQLAAIACDSNFDEVASFESKIAFVESEADPEALALNHYSAAEWQGAPSGDAVARKFAQFLSRFKSVELTSKRTGRPYSVARLAGHNAATFDAPRLRRMFEKAGEFPPFHPIPLDTLQLAMWHFQRTAEKPKNFQLSTIADALGIDTEGAHDALADVRMCAAITKKLAGK